MSTSPYLSFLLGAPSLSDEELLRLGIEIAERRGRSVRCLRIPPEVVPCYLELVAAKLEPGYWNEAVGEREILFVFKLEDGAVRQYTYSRDTEPEIAALCARLNGEPPERTRNVLKYLATNAYYRDALAHWYGVAPD